MMCIIVLIRLIMDNYIFIPICLYIYMCSQYDYLLQVKTFDCTQDNL